ncbi:site-specific integrase [Streptomyces mirabilis]|uniref:site-specific integrase n=1 Tax=Streptomyces mirabilis TaxID=68239 RepID=UPI00367BF2EB
MGFERPVLPGASRLSEHGPAYPTRQDKLRALWELALRTGLRRGELLGLTWADLDPAAGTLNIRRSLQHNPAGGLTLFPTKTRAAERRIALPTTCLTALEQHRQNQERQRMAAGARWRENGLIFTTRVGTPLDPSDVARRFTGLLDQAGIRRIRFHDLRHTCATLLLEQGVQLITIKELLDTPTSASPPRSTPTSACASNTTPSTNSPTYSGMTTIPKTRR